MVNLKNSQKGELIKEILIKSDRQLKEMKVGDSTKFEEIDGISLKNLKPISFNNKVCMFISEENVKNLGLNSIEELIGKSVTYAIELPNGSLLFGHTSDVGERTHTYTKDARSCESRFFRDFRKYGNAVFSILRIGTKEEVKKYEKDLIEGYKLSIFCEEVGCDVSTYEEYSKGEVNAVVGKYIYNIINY